MNKTGTPQVVELYAPTIEGRSGRALIVQQFEEEFVPQASSPRGTSLYSADELGVAPVITPRQRTCFIDNRLDETAEQLQARLDNAGVEIVRRVAVEPFGTPRFIYRLSREDASTRTRKIRQTANNQLVKNPSNGFPVFYRGLPCFQVWDLEQDSGLSHARTIDYRSQTMEELAPLRGEDNNRAIFFPEEWLDEVFTNWEPGMPVDDEVLTASEETPVSVSVIKEDVELVSEAEVEEIEMAMPDDL
jgi:hypothetical protein